MPGCPGVQYGVWAEQGKGRTLGGPDLSGRECVEILDPVAETPVGEVGGSREAEGSKTSGTFCNR